MSDWFAANGDGKSVDASALIDDASSMIGDIVQHGALVSVGTTSDGGALGVTVTLDGRWRREYFRDGEALLAWLTEAAAAVAAAPVRTPASSGQRQRARGSRGL